MRGAGRSAGPRGPWRAACLAVCGLAVLWAAGCGNDEGGGGLDTTAPVITSGPTVAELTTGAARITWTTDEASNSAVRYGPDTTTIYQAIDAAPVTSHAVTLRSGLRPDSTVYFRVESYDLSQNLVRSAVDSFVPPHASLAFSPDPASSAGGQRVTVDLTATAVTDLFQAAVVVLFDPAIVACDSIVAGAFLRGVADTVVAASHVDNDTGQAEIGLTRVGGAGGRDGGGVLARLHFRPVGAGTTALTVRSGAEDPLLRDRGGALMVNYDGLELEPGTVVVSTR